MKTSGVKEIGGVCVGKKQLYNPNRFNGLTAAISYVVALAAFAALPYVMVLCCRNFLLKLYKFDTFAYMLVNVGISQALILLIVLAVSLVKRTNPLNGGGYVAKWDGVQALMGAVGIVGIMTVFYSIHSDFASDSNYLFGITGSDIEENYSPFSGLFAIAYLFVMSVFPAIIEEMAFRGIIMRGLEQFGNVFAVIVSSVAFSLMHGNFSQMILQFIGGLAIGSVVMITKNWLIGSFMHFFNNAFSITYTLVLENFDGGISSLRLSAAAHAATTLIGLACLIIAIVYFAGVYTHNVKRETSGTVKEEKYAIKRYYAVKQGEDERLVESNVIPETRRKNEYDDRRFLIWGKYRKLNKKSNPVATYILLGAGLVLAIVGLFL